VDEAKLIAAGAIEAWPFAGAIGFGLPEIDDRYDIWRVPLLSTSGTGLGEVVIGAHTGLIDEARTTDRETAASRRELALDEAERGSAEPRAAVRLSPLENTIICGDSRETLAVLPAESVDLVFTSPPYFNARPGYSDYVAYEDYLETIRQVIRACHRVLQDGRFFVINVAPVLVRRTKRSESSRRIGVPFDMHRLFVEEGFDFVDDIIWEKPEGAGWATGRGRRFAADRNPLQYKAVPVTEYVLVFRKRTSKLIDWHIRSHPDRELVERSKIRGEYERTNIWKISPTSSPLHPAVFPVALAERVVRYYSFEQDVVLDPFAGIGTVGEAATRLGRRFVLSELNSDYVEVIRQRAEAWLGPKAAAVTFVPDAAATAPRRAKVTP
jgi:DNA modification methylase